MIIYSISDTCGLAEVVLGWAELSLSLSYRLSPGMLHISLILLGWVGHLRHFLLQMMPEAQKWVPRHACRFCFAYVTPANSPLAKTYDMPKPKVQSTHHETK